MTKALFTACLIAGTAAARAQAGNTGIGTLIPGSTLDVKGSIASQYRFVAATTYTMDAADFCIAWSGSSNGTISLPTAAAIMKGRIYYIKNASLSRTVTVVPAGSETIGQSSAIVVSAGQTVQLMHTGLTGANATWELIGFTNATVTGPDLTTANNGLTTTGNNIQLGGSLTQATTISNAGNSLTVLGAASATTFAANGNLGIGVLNPSEALDVQGTVRLRNVPLSGGTATLTIDNNGVVCKQAPPAVVLGSLGAGAALNSGNWGGYNYTGTSITIPANSKYIVYVASLLTANGSPAPTLGQAIWVRSTFSTTSTPPFASTPDIIGSSLISGVLTAEMPFNVLSGQIILNNTSGSPRTYYYIAGTVATSGGWATPLAPVMNTFAENQLHAIPTN